MSATRKLRLGPLSKAENLKLTFAGPAEKPTSMATPRYKQMRMTSLSMR